MLKNLFKRRSKSEIVILIIASIVMGLFVLSYTLSYGWAILAGLKTQDEIVMTPFALPQEWLFENYVQAFTMLKVRGVDMIGMILNSLIMVLIGPFLSIAGSAILAYVVSKYRFRGRNVLIAVNVIVMTLPIIGSTASTYRLYSSLGMIDSPTLMISRIGCFGGNFLYMLSCFNNTSNAYMEAARIDGAGHYTIMFKVMMPMAMGTASALWILQLIGVWNDVNTSLLYWPSMPTLATGIYLFQTTTTMRATKHILIAATVLSSIPPLMLFVFFHKKILANVTFGGIKG